MAKAKLDVKFQNFQKAQNKITLKVKQKYQKGQRYISRRKTANY